LTPSRSNDGRQTQLNQAAAMRSAIEGKMDRNPRVQRRCLSVALLSALIAIASPSGSVVAAAADRSSSEAVAALPTAQTEEGQTVVYDKYTWQRRELAKRLPLDQTWPSENDINAVFTKYGLEKSSIQYEFIPARITRDVYLVNTKPNLTYLIDTGSSGLVIVDPGLEENVESILNNVEALGFSRKSIKWVLNTHAHFDHSMADVHFQRLGAKILVGRADVPAVEKGTLVTAKYAPFLHQNAAYPKLTVDWPVDDGEEIILGNKTFVAISTPGHTPGSTCFFLTIDDKNILFGGDTILFDYRLGAQATPFADNVAYLASLKKIANFNANPTLRSVRWDMLLPGHGVIVLDHAYVDVLKDLRQVQWDVTNGAAVSALPFADDDYRKLMFGRPGS